MEIAMGYWTNYSVDVCGEQNAVAKTFQDIKKVNPDLAELADQGYSYLKWYEWEEDMTKVAKMNPDVLIILTGDGEDNDDLWEARFKGDLMERQDWALPPFQTKELLLPNEQK